MSDSAHIYQELGVTSFINAAGTYTTVGGSRMRTATLRAMQEAAQQYTDIVDLQRVVGQRLAELTNNEMACVCNSASAGLYLCALAAVAIKLNKEIKYLHQEEIRNCEVLSLAAQHIPYDHAVKQSGVKQVFVGYPNIPDSTTLADLENAITPQTAAIFFYLSSPYSHNTPGALPLADVITVGQRHQLPVIVDAAAQLPPVENLWRFTQQGATAALFSGGKDLRGPQASGLVVGQRNFLVGVHASNFPHYGFGRMFKVGREEIVGLYQAVKDYVEFDHQKRFLWCGDVVKKIMASGAASKLYRMRALAANEAGQPIPYIEVSVLPPLGLSEVAEALFLGQPSVFVRPDQHSFYINPMTLEMDEVEAVIDKLHQVEDLLSQN